MFALILDKFHDGRFTQFLDKFHDGSFTIEGSLLGVDHLIFDGGVAGFLDC